MSNLRCEDITNIVFLFVLAFFLLAIVLMMALSPVD